jgi:hypothetical protein
MREKLIEILETVVSPKELLCDGEVVVSTARVADHLIANGVTFAEDNNVPSKWIPVTERLPEIGDSYLVVVKYKYDWETEYDIDTDVATFYPYDNPDAYIDNRWDTYNDWDEGQQYIHITHWMPLPQAPKGE